MKLPLKNACYSKLHIKGISDRTKSVHRKFAIEQHHATLEDYCDVSLTTYALLLADEFETYWNTCLKYCKLDPAYFTTAPGLAWQALLKTASEYYEQEAKYKDCELCLD